MKYYKYDIFRELGCYKESLIKKMTRTNGLKYIIIFRKANSAHNILTKFYYKLKLRRISKKTFIQIPKDTIIGKGFYIGHNGRIIINSHSIIGDNVNLATGVVIGRENRGKRIGCPTIGNEVWIGANSVIVGKINIGNDVLIAPLSYVNFDVPDHSVVMGNPAKILPKEHATDNYINNKV